MTLIVTALVGWLAGWLVARLSDYLPRFAAAEPVRVPHSWATAPALWRALVSPPASRWFRLELVVELASALFFAGAWATYGVSGQMALVTGGYSYFLLIAVMDIKYRLVLNILTFPAIALLVGGHLLLNQRGFPNVLVGGIFAFSIFYLVARLKPGDVGSGDIKLAALIGVCFGFPMMLVALILGAGAGAGAAVYLLTRQQTDAKTYIPYAPFLCLGALVAILVTV
jgi:leader peptidase (prepilin peptidase)/N-methyltransferase